MSEILFGRKTALLGTLSVCALLSGVACTGAPPKDGSVPKDPAGEAFSGGVTPVEVRREGTVRLVSAVREATHTGYDRMVWEHGTEPGGYRVAYVDGPVLACGSGEPVAVEGAAILTVTLQPAAAHSEQGTSLIAQKSLKPGHTAVRSMTQVCDLEGRVTWAIGTRERLPFRVTLLENPTRLVVDVQH